MADKGWVAVHRSIRDHWLYQEKRVFSKYEAWLDLVMDANHKRNKFVFDGNLVEVERGQKITSIRQLSERWRWSRTKVTDFLILLEKDGMLVRKSDSKKTVITIVNYDFYQNQENKESHSSDTEKPQKSTNNNDKTMNNNDNNNNPRNSPKIREYADDDPNKKLAVLLLKLIRKNQNIKEPDLNKWANTIRLTIESDKRTGREVQDMIVWATNHDFWSTVILSPTSLRKHFDKMTSQKDKVKHPKGGQRLENTNSSEYDDLPI
ncbi:hypothetical protein IGI57_002513 [Enterococcus sp. DIV0213j]|jgi:hypothetical protein|uniref:hypothetical protein n=1 Tax=Enterococcus sp. DIV0213j TaxID=2774649 RepID=UPI003D2E8D00